MGLLCPTFVFGQNSNTRDTPFQVAYAANLATGDSVINLTNTGASNANICVNVYAFSPDEQLIACCTCTVTPNGLTSLSARNDLVALTPAQPGSIVVKLIATAPDGCDAALPGPRVQGLAAWMTTTHVLGTPKVTENQFAPATLGELELARVGALCGVTRANGSGYGICRTCRSGALGAIKR